MAESRKKIIKRVRTGMAPEGSEPRDAVAEVAELRGRGDGRDQLHAKLVPPASAALARLMELTHMGKGDVANRALQIYLFLEEEKLDGGELLIRKNGEMQVVHIV